MANRNNIPEITKQILDAITWKHTGKMESMYSLSTSVLLNAYCEARRKNPDSICSHCYAAAMTEGIYKTMQPKLERNTKLLTESVIPVELWPIINAAFFRFEAFGDLNNVTQIENYFNFCRKNKHVHFALWTKNTFLLFQAEKKGIKKPSNLIIIESSPFVNVPAKKTHKWIDKVFTVWDKEHAKKNPEMINCGARHCMSCLKCYKKNKYTEINEIMK